MALLGIKGILLHDANTLEEVGFPETHAKPDVDTNWSISAAFSPDGTILASANGEKMVRLWDVAGQNQIGVLEGHTDQVKSMAFSQDGKVLASGGGNFNWRNNGDPTIRLWDVQARKEIGMLEGHLGWMRLAFSPDGETLASRVP